MFLGLSAGGVLKPEMVKQDGGQPDHPGAGQPEPGDHAGGRARRCATTPSWPPAAPTIRTRSTTSCASPTSSAARSTAARPPSRRRWRSRRCTRSPSWRRPSRARWWPPPMPAQQLAFGPEYLIPKPFDPRLMMKIAPAVAKAAADSGVALRPIKDMDAYREKLQSFVYASGTDDEADLRRGQGRARTSASPTAEGEEERVLRAAQIVVDEGIARPDADRPAGRHRPAHREVRPAAAGRAATTTWSTSSRTSATATSGRPTTA